MRPARLRRRERSTRIEQPSGSVGSMLSPATPITVHWVGSMPCWSSQSRRKAMRLVTVSSSSSAPPPAAAASSRTPICRAPGRSRISSEIAGSASAGRKSSGIGSPPGVRYQPRQRVRGALKIGQAGRGEKAGFSIWGTEREILGKTRGPM